jgi:hypothetical protein
MIRADLDQLNMEEVFTHYQERTAVSAQLQELFQMRDQNKFVSLALGISNAHGNYSAREHNLGPQILSSVQPSEVLNLAVEISRSHAPNDMIDSIYRRKIPYLKISVGSEIAMMLEPEKFWVANTRSVWAHLLVKHDFNHKTANEELNLYRDKDEGSEMAYRKWKSIYSDMRPNMIELGTRGDKQAKKQRVKTGSARNIWYDAIANALYENR